jgi:hypothetical protein
LDVHNSLNTKILKNFICKPERRFLCKLDHWHPDDFKAVLQYKIVAKSGIDGEENTLPVLALKF